MHKRDFLITLGNINLTGCPFSLLKKVKFNIKMESPSREGVNIKPTICKNNN